MKQAIWTGVAVLTSLAALAVSLRPERGMSRIPVRNGGESGAVRELSDLRGEVATLRRRVEELERIRPTVSKTAESEPVALTKAPESSKKAPSSAAPAAGAWLEEVRGLLRSGASSKEMNALLESMRKEGAQDALIAALLTALEANPTDAPGHYLLGRAYIERLHLVPDGPEKGVWAEKAMGEFERAIELNPSYWEPQYAKAVSLSWYPEQLGRTPDAIREFERTIQLQNRSTANPTYADSYSHLARLYTKVGKQEKAEAVLREGLSLFPGNEQLQKQLSLQQE